MEFLLIIFSVDQGVTNGSVCFTWGLNSCNWKQSIRIKNCGSHYVYQLPPPPECYLRYCTDRYGEIEILYSQALYRILLQLWLIYVWSMHVDFCKPNPCQHGICQSTQQGFRCHCKTGYTGSYCEQGTLWFTRIEWIASLIWMDSNFDAQSPNKRVVECRHYWRHFRGYRILLSLSILYAMQYLNSASDCNIILLVYYLSFKVAIDDL